MPAKMCGAQEKSFSVLSKNLKLALLVILCYYYISTYILSNSVSRISFSLLLCLPLFVLYH